MHLSVTEFQSRLVKMIGRKQKIHLQLELETATLFSVIDQGNTKSVRHRRC